MRCKYSTFLDNDTKKIENQKINTFILLFIYILTRKQSKLVHFSANAINFFKPGLQGNLIIAASSTRRVTCLHLTSVKMSNDISKSIQINIRFNWHIVPLFVLMFLLQHWTNWKDKSEWVYYVDIIQILSTSVELCLFLELNKNNVLERFF